MMTDNESGPALRPPRYDRRVSRKAAGPLVAVISVAVPLVILGNALLVLLIPSFAELQYALPGFPADPLGLSGADRDALGATGIRSIWPVGPGVELLREARLPDGREAFGSVEIRHMDDVRGLVQACFVLWLVALVGAAAAVFGLRSSGRREDIRRGLRGGSVLTIALMGLIGVAMLINFDFIFDGFHEVFFESGTWTFSQDETLMRLYPEVFWGIASGLLATLALAQALLLLAAARLPESRRADGPEGV
jgi:integral membrane protein (TIGR01906 family)